MALARQAVPRSPRAGPRRPVQAAAAVGRRRLVELVQPLAAAAVRRAPRRRPPGRAGHDDARTTWSSRSPTCSGSTTSSPPATASTPTARYDGTLDGPFVWAPGKLAAVRAWADEHGIDLAESYAYSDSVYDTPLLAAVGHPFVVNPDPRLPLMAAARRWPTLHLDVPAGRRRSCRSSASSSSSSRLQLHPPELVPVRPLRHRRRRPHPRRRARRSSSATTAATSTRWRWRSRSPRAAAPVRFLGKKEVFDAPVVGQLAAAMGGIRVDRGTGSDEPLHEAAAALAAGDLVAIMPQGTIPRGAGVLRPGAEGPLGRGPAGRDDRGAGDPDRAVGHREGLAPLGAPAERAQRHRPADGARPRRRAGRAQATERRRRHQADHGGDHGPAAARGPRAAHTPTAEEIARTLPARQGARRRRTRRSAPAAPAPTDPTRPKRSRAAIWPPGGPDRYPRTCRITSAGLFGGDLAAHDVERRAGPEPLDLLVAEGVHALEVDRSRRRA